jgi:hypothetical protein
MATCNLSARRIRNPERYARIAALIEQFDTFERQYAHTVSRAYWLASDGVRSQLESALKAARAGHRTRADGHLRYALRLIGKASAMRSYSQALDKLAA